MWGLDEAVWQPFQTRKCPLIIDPVEPRNIVEQVTYEDWSRWACAAGKKKNEVKEPQMQEVRGKRTGEERDSAEQKLQSKSALAWRVNARWSGRHRLQNSLGPDKHCPWPCSAQKQRSRLQKSSGENAENMENMENALTRT